MNKDMEIKAVSGMKILPHLHWLTETPKHKQVDSEPTESIAINALQGKYHGLLGLVRGVPVGLLIYSMHSKTHIEFKFLYGKSQIIYFYMELMEYLNGFKIKTFEAESYHGPKLWEKLFPGRMKVLRTTYLFDVEGLFNSKSQQKRMDIQTASWSLKE